MPVEYLRPCLRAVSYLTRFNDMLKIGAPVDAVTYSPTYRGGGFSLKHGSPYSINELSPCAPRL